VNHGSADVEEPCGFRITNIAGLQPPDLQQTSSDAFGTRNIDISFDSRSPPVIVTTIVPQVPDLAAVQLHGDSDLTANGRL
jgi:hypothetical protein